MGRIRILLPREWARVGTTQDSFNSHTTPSLSGLKNKREEFGATTDPGKKVDSRKERVR